MCGHQRKTVARQLHCETARAFPCGHAENVPRQCAQNSAPIDAFVLIEPGVLARQHCGDEVWRDFAQRDFETIGPRQAAVNFSIDIVNGASFGHFADVFHVERLGPGAVKKKNGEHRARQQKKKRDLPAVAKENISARFLWASKASEQFHHRKVKKVKRVTRLKPA